MDSPMRRYMLAAGLSCRALAREMGKSKSSVAGKVNGSIPWQQSDLGYRPKCVSVLACVPLWQWAFLLFELYGRGTRGRPECVSGMAGQALRHNG